MNNDIPLRGSTREKRRSLIFASIAIMSVTLIFMSLIFFYYLPSFEKGKINHTNETNIYYMGNKLKFSAIEQNDQLYIPFSFVKEKIDPTIQWDNKNKMVIITTNENVYHFPFGKTEGMLNLEPYSFTYPVIENNGHIYLPISPLKDYYDLEFMYLKDASVVLVYDLKEPVQQGIVTKNTKLRESPTFRSAWISEIESGKKLSVMKEVNGWYWIEAEGGLLGYINKETVKLQDIKVNKIKKTAYQPWNPIGEPIVLTWEYASEKTVDPKKIGDLSGLHVVSPTWFHLQKDGLIKNAADIKYVEWAHKNGYQVWGLFSNSFDPDLTHEMLSDSNIRIKVIKQLLSYVDLYKLDGINLDFENVYLKDKEVLVQFVRELTPLLHEKDRVVSMDVTFKSKSENWSMFYDRKQLGEIVDYIIVMGYDEHWASSPKAGSVSSLPWVEKGIKEILEEVSNEKVILGIPFYTRLWIEEKDENGNIKVSSKTFSMEQTEDWLQKNNVEVKYDNISGQHYAELIKENVTYKIWIEDIFSIEKRINIMKKYHLAGIASWRRGFENNEVWTGINEIINQRP